MQRFIDLGWHTVPLGGKLERLADGKKTIPEFKKNWRTRYQDEFNKEVTAIGGVMTGKVSNIIAIDCDSHATYSIFKALDPDYKFVFESEGKGYPAGTIIYRYTEELPDNFSIKSDDIELDFYSNSGFVYLPTEANKTKKPFEMCNIKSAPMSVVALLRQLKPTEIRLDKVKNISTANCLQPLVEKFVSTGEFLPGLFRIITPKKFRQERQYVENGYLHPNNVPSGAGSDYLSRVSAILGKDPSIDEGLYTDAMLKINTLWDEPMDESRLEKTILDPMITGGATIDGQPIWFYDPAWKEYNLAIHTKRDNLLYLGYDDTRHSYYTVDPEREVVTSYDRDSELVAHINTVGLAPPKKPDLIRSMPLINVVNSPKEDFGFIETADDRSVKTLNLFKRTVAMSVLLEPNLHENNYREPVWTLKYFTTLIPNELARNWLLSFIKRKLTKFEYSPVVLYFIGVHGSGKDTLVNLLESIIGKVTRPTTQEFLEKYNTYMMDTYFVQLDEYGDQLSTFREKEEARGKIKAYSGKANIDIRQMRTDGFQYMHNVTFIMTANKNPLTLEEGDRRVAYFNTPNKLTEQFTDVPTLLDNINAELLDFCYYLATEVDELTRVDFTVPFESEERHVLIADSMPAAARIQYAMKHRMHNYLIQLGDYYNIDLQDEVLRGTIEGNTMEDLYMEMTENKGDIRALNKMLRTAGIDVKRSGAEVRYRLGAPDVNFERGA